MQCPHTECQQIWRTLHDAIYKLHIKQNAPLQYYNTLAYGLYVGCRAQPPQQLQINEADTQQLQQEQAELGWKQLYYGRLMTAWANSITAQNNTIKGMVFYSKVLLLIWQAVIGQWNLCNQHLHPKNAMVKDCTQLECIVYQILQEAQADPNLQDLVTSFEPQVLLNCPIKHIQQWIDNSRNHMQVQKKAATLQACLHMHDIRTYFTRSAQQQQPNTNEKNLL